METATYRTQPIALCTLSTSKRKKINQKHCPAVSHATTHRHLLHALSPARSSSLCTQFTYVHPALPYSSVGTLPTSNKHPRAHPRAPPHHRHPPATPKAASPTHPHTPFRLSERAVCGLAVGGGGAVPFLACWLVCARVWPVHDQLVVGSRWLVDRVGWLAYRYGGGRGGGKEGTLGYGGGGWVVR
ncbi:hypothetical protein P167DRAFT_75196 [Morchella conica CCBAS932]|uniref:Uncharacterized protein n=1 Tax=Morchella conica CCBAS932 TaxID=1392247 RepID=A0A3N4KXH0_9PEZI|nr:hypothetical protein P167DRAFT_75196 [Morchella conica CCBAS932]